MYTIVIYFTISITDGHACIISAGEDGFIPVHFVSGSTVRLTGKSWGPLSWYSCSAKVWSNTWIKHTTGKNEPRLVSAPIFRVRDQSTIILKIVIFIRFCMVNRQGVPVHFICHTKPYNNRNFQIDGGSQYFGVWVWQLVHLLILVCSFQWCVLFLCLTKLYRSCPIHDKGLLPVYNWIENWKENWSWAC